MKRIIFLFFLYSGHTKSVDEIWFASFLGGSLFSFIYSISKLNPKQKYNELLSQAREKDRFDITKNKNTDYFELQDTKNNYKVIYQACKINGNFHLKNYHNSLIQDIFINSLIQNALKLDKLAEEQKKLTEGQQEWQNSLREDTLTIDGVTKKRTTSADLKNEEITQDTKIYRYLPKNKLPICTQFTCIPECNKLCDHLKNSYKNMENEKESNASNFQYAQVIKKESYEEVDFSTIPKKKMTKKDVMLFFGAGAIGMGATYGILRYFSHRK